MMAVLWQPRRQVSVSESGGGARDGPQRVSHPSGENEAVKADAPNDGRRQWGWWEELINQMAHRSVELWNSTALKRCSKPSLDHVNGRRGCGAAAHAPAAPRRRSASNCAPGAPTAGWRRDWSFVRSASFRLACLTPRTSKRAACLASPARSRPASLAPRGSYRAACAPLRSYPLAQQHAYLSAATRSCKRARIDRAASIDRPAPCHRSRAEVPSSSLITEPSEKIVVHPPACASR
jgi:hypothetical protein